MKYRNAPEAPVVRFVPATVREGALFVIRCPLGCRETTPTGRPKKNGGPKEHVHGAGRLGDDHRDALGHRSQHCPDPITGHGYIVTDPSGVVPARSTEAAS